MMRWAPSLCVTLSIALAQAPVRDVARTPAPGTASIAGVIVTDDAEPRPLRRARIILENPDLDFIRTTISDDAGRFTFRNLVAGRYTLGAVKEGYVRVNYGAAWTGGPGASISLADGLALNGLTLPLPRGATITGVLLDADGQPIPGVSMRALRYGFTPGGERRLTPVNITMAGHITDDRGLYRIYGLAAGQYVVAAPASVPSPGGSQVVIMSEGEIRRALEEVKQGQRRTAVEPDVSPTADATESQAIGYAPVFYPGTTVASQAVLIPLGKGEERTGVDFQLQHVPMATITGSVYSPQLPSEFVRVYLIPTGDVTLSVDTEVRSTLTRPQGEFSFANVAPGTYTVLAKGLGLGLQSNGPLAWATVEVRVEGQSERSVMLSLQPALAVSGRVAFAGRPPAPDPTDVRVTLVPVLSGGQVSLATVPARVDSTGRFTIRGVTAARYRLQATITGQPRWMLSSSTALGRDAIDVPLDVKQSVDGAVVTFTDAPGELSGVVQDGGGKPVASQTVILFTSDRAWWTPMSRRVRAAISSAAGTFSFRMLPAGEYWLTATSHIESGEQYDPALLERLAANGAVKTTIAEGEKKTLDVALDTRR
jgi:uncharacterized protein (DUF2141 family)